MLQNLSNMKDLMELTIKVISELAFASVSHMILVQNSSNENVTDDTVVLSAVGDHWRQT